MAWVNNRPFHDVKQVLQRSFRKKFKANFLAILLAFVADIECHLLDWTNASCNQICDLVNNDVYNRG